MEKKKGQLDLTEEEYIGSMHGETLKRLYSQEQPTDIPGKEPHKKRVFRRKRK